MATQVEYGLGFSPISFKNVEAYAFNEEMAAQKDVGIFGIVEKTGDNKYIVSAEYLARQKFQLQNFVNLLMQTNSLGKIYRLKIDNFAGRAITGTTSNMINGSSLVISDGTTKINALRFNFDMDVSSKSDAGLLHFNDATVTFEYTLTVGSTSSNFSITDTIFNINRNKYPIDYSSITIGASDNISITLTSLVITLGTSFDASTDRIGLYDILLVTL